MHARVCARHSLQVSHPTSTETHSFTHSLAAGFNGCLNIPWRHPKRTQRVPYCLKCLRNPIHILEQEPEIQWRQERLSMHDIKTCQL